jgi:small subunit ribosomal protein S16
MAVKIRLMRIGAKKRPFYRVVAVDEQKKRTGAYLELLGTYNPLTEPKEIKLNQELIDSWLKKGAQPSDGFLRIIGKAPQKPPRKPKKDQGKAPAPEAKAAVGEADETAESAVSGEDSKETGETPASEEKAGQQPEETAEAAGEPEEAKEENS